ncbi:MAG: CRISPR-associated helicase Cas3' [Prolixibacteraceae bacterium]|jgi:CRISPR-associated endonuclease/helicase Cas3|nr:CRISPR-associated helicase Cas3' [Ignavibacteriaceae bacterium]MCK9412392.1 CRISPR-associated helicase Cas3' [Prolixibacteraceae bacterium]
MKSFRCFKESSTDLLGIYSKLQQDYFAHLSHDKQLKESLFEHSKLVLDYCLKLIEVHGLEKVINSSITRLVQILPIGNQEDWGNLLKKAFIGAIVYHDLGKANPNFQVMKMGNELFGEDKSLSIQSNHSFLGAYLYANIFFKNIIENEKLNEADDEKLLLYFIVLLFSGAIAKHHNSTINLSLDFDERQIDDCYSFLKTYGIHLDEVFCKSYYVEAQNILNEFREMVDNPEIYFNLFATTKLLYSLLTASDFYATSEFMSKVKIDEFGILNKEEKVSLIDKFRSVKSYNKDLYSKIEHYCSFPIDQLNERSNQNLNILRQKLTAEMIFNLRDNSNKYCFYIEAPTGAGKTNLSLAFATELLSIDPDLNKIFYVFPFTTLITQTFKAIKETLEINNDFIIQLHSKAGFHERQDGSYGNEKRLFVDNLFVNYPIALLSHIRFFDILKGNEKESNYLLHRLCNSIVIIDEIQTYNPEHWDKIVYFLANYAKLLNIRVLIMSATLPKIDALYEDLKGTFVSLITHRDAYFTNPNFAERVSFNFSLTEKKRPDGKEEKEKYLYELSDFMIDKAEQYASTNRNSVKVLIEFITKETASSFFSIISKSNRFEDYEILILSGDILEFRRKQIINSIKGEEFHKVIVVSTQVVEAGVDIDMDLGFKDRSLIDSDEQLAGRINRNASKDNCIVYLFDCDKTSIIYGSDFRYKVQQTNKEIFADYKEILVKKQFHALYEKVFEEKLKKMKSNLFAAGHYYQYFNEFDFIHLHKEFELIENNDSQQLFIPISIPIQYFDNFAELERMRVLSENGKHVDGFKVFNVYERLVRCDPDDFVLKQIEMKKMGSILSQFCISIYKKQHDAISTFLDPEKDKFGFKYLSNWKLCYSPEYGFDSEKIDTSIFL